MILSYLPKLMAGVLMAASFSASADFAKDCPQFFPGAAPYVQRTVPGSLRELCFGSFAVMHSGQAKTPVYVAERLNRALLQDAMDEERTDRFYEEARLPHAERARLQDYARSGYDRGHLQYPVKNILNQ